MIAVGRAGTAALTLLMVLPFILEGGCPMASEPSRQGVELPAPHTDGGLSLEQALARRRSIRSFSDRPLTLAETGQLLWAAQGLSSDRGYRTAPSAGATYPLEIYVAAGHVTDLDPGLYRYRPDRHDLTPVAGEDIREAVFRAALQQRAVRSAPAVFLMTAVVARTTDRYGERGVRYVYMEAGHAAQNMCLQAVSLGLGSVVIGAFRDRELQSVMGLGTNEIPLYVIPVGR